MASYIEALDALAYSRPGLDPANYGDAASYRADQRANMRDLADYGLLRLYVAPKDAELADAARGSRIKFSDNENMRDWQVAVDYCAGQYYPREYRAACVRLLVTIWWTAVARRRPEWTADDIRAYARREFGIGLARRWFS